MGKTLFIASFPDLGSFDFSKTGIKVGDIDNSDYYFDNNNSNYIHSYIDSLKNMVGTCDVLFVPATDSVIKALENDGIKCVVLYPNKSCKDSFIKDMINSKMEEAYVSMIEDSWDFIISHLDKRNYDYKFVMGEDDNVLDILHSLLSKKDVLGVEKTNVSLSINDRLVNDIFSYCLLDESEFNEGKPIIQSTFCEGIKYDYFFSTKRINDKKDNISFLVDSISSIEDGISVANMGINREGREWTHSLDTLEKVMVLGVTSGDLLIPFPRNFDKSLKGCLPYVIKTSVLEKNATI